MKVEVWPDHHGHRLSTVALSRFVRCPYRYYRGHVMRTSEGKLLDEAFVARTIRYALRGLLWSKQQTGQHPEPQDVEQAVLEILTENDVRKHVDPILSDEITNRIQVWLTKCRDVVPRAVETPFEMECLEGEKVVWVLGGKLDLVFTYEPVTTASINRMGILDLGGRYHGRSARFLREDLHLVLTAIGGNEGLGVEGQGLSVFSFPPPDWKTQVTESDLVVMDLVFSEEDRSRAMIVARAARQSILDHLHREAWYPNRKAPECRRTLCKSWRSCQKHFGGEIPP